MTLKGLRRLQPRARLSKLDYFYAGITSTRLHRENMAVRPRSPRPFAGFFLLVTPLSAIYFFKKNKEKETWQADVNGFEGPFSVRTRSKTSLRCRRNKNLELRHDATDPLF